MWSIFFLFSAIYAGDYYLYEDSETDSDSDFKEDVPTEDLTLSTQPKQTSEQQETLIDTYVDEDSTVPVNDTVNKQIDVDTIDVTVDDIEKKQSDKGNMRHSETFKGYNSHESAFCYR